MNVTIAPKTSSDLELVITRVFDAPRHLVWKVWTDPAHAEHWMGPRGFAAPHIEQDARVGGSWRLCLRPDGGGEYLWQGGVFREIKAPERIVFTFAWDGPGGRRGHESLVTVTLEEQGNKTKLTFRQAFFESVEQRDGHRVGWSSSFDRLADYALAQVMRPPLMLTRSFDAPRALVWKAWCDPKQMAIWWGPKGFTNPVCEMDVRPGGKIHIDMTGPDGTVYPMGGTFHEVVAPERLVFTATAFDSGGDLPDLVDITTVTFVERDGKTVVTVHAVVVRASPAMAGPLSGMEQGWSESLDRLDDLVKPR
ncbi:MAG: SRPBCC domain-containing protein [Alphaproteobacteria bacterium]